MTSSRLGPAPAREKSPDPRLDRQLRILEWDQRALDEARIAVFGDDDLLASLYLLSAAALGVNDIVLVAPRWDGGLVETARQLNPKVRLALIEGLHTHPILDGLFLPCSVIVDLTRYALANKLLLETAFRSGIPLIRGFCVEGDGLEGLAVFTYRRGREWQALWDLLSPSNLPREHFDDGILDLVAAGIALEETKNVLMGQTVSEDLIGYRRPKLETRWADARVAVVGAGALGNFVGLGLAFAGARNVTVMDPDLVDVTNLNRQVLLAGGVSRPKAEVLCQRLESLFGIRAEARAEYLGKDTGLAGFDAIFDCVDNFETRIVLSERCRDEGKILISGGTGPGAGQVIVFDPTRGTETPAELLGLGDIVEGRSGEVRRRDAAACALRPEPSVVMANQIVGALMVDSWRKLLAGAEAPNVFYDARNDARIFA
jgi:molybdopterin/thiamine biosynthesis adenylyltransferase